MDFRKQIENKSQEFRKVLLLFEELKGTGTVGNSAFINTVNRVTYKQNVEEGKSRIGKINDNLNKNHMSIRLDLPKNEFSVEYLMQSIGLKIIPREQRANFTCLKLHRACWDHTVFDTIDIKLYKEDIATYNFNSAAFIEFMNLLVLRASGEIIEIPNT